MREEPPNYVVWFVVIVLGVGVGQLLANFVSYLMVVKGIELTLKGVSQDMQRRTKASAVAARQRQFQRQAQGRAERVKSDRGRELLRVCNQWRANLARLDTDTVRRQTQQHCGAYQRYIEYGRY